MKWRIKKIGEDKIREIDIDNDDIEPIDDSGSKSCKFSWSLWLGILVVIVGVILLAVMISTSRIETKANNLETRVNSLRIENEKLQEQINENISRGESDDWVCGLMNVTCKNENSIIGVASYYDYRLDSGWSSLGHRVCATRDFERGNTVRVTNLDNGKSVDCLVTDHGPNENVFPERVIDLSSHAFSQIAPLKQGVIKNIKVELL